MESAEPEEFQRAEEAAETEEEDENIVDIRSQLQVDERVSIRVSECIADARGLVVSPDVDSNACPRAHDDADIDVRPEIEKVRATQSNQRSTFH